MDNKAKPIDSNAEAGPSGTGPGEDKRAAQVPDHGLCTLTAVPPYIASCSAPQAAIDLKPAEFTFTGA